MSQKFANARSTKVLLDFLWCTKGCQLLPPWIEVWNPPILRWLESVWMVSGWCMVDPWYCQYCINGYWILGSLEMNQRKIIVLISWFILSGPWFAIGYPILECLYCTGCCLSVSGYCLRRVLWREIHWWIELEIFWAAASFSPSQLSDSGYWGVSCASNWYKSNEDLFSSVIFGQNWPYFGVSGRCLEVVWMVS